jgi:hypothetical protein
MHLALGFPLQLGLQRLSAQSSSLFAQRVGTGIAPWQGKRI